MNFYSPLEIGQKVWFLRYPKTKDAKLVLATVEKISFTAKGGRMKLSVNKIYETSFRSIGKTVFLNREEAIKALEV